MRHWVELHVGSYCDTCHEHHRGNVENHRILHECRPRTSLCYSSRLTSTFTVRIFGSHCATVPSLAQHYQFLFLIFLFEKIILWFISLKSEKYFYFPNIYFFVYKYVFDNIWTCGPWSSSAAVVEELVVVGVVTTAVLVMELPLPVFSENQTHPRILHLPTR